VAPGPPRASPRRRSLEARDNLRRGAVCRPSGRAQLAGLRPS
jgi:hypothetical protein